MEQRPEYYNFNVEPSRDGYIVSWQQEKPGILLGGIFALAVLVLSLVFISVFPLALILIAALVFWLWKTIHKTHQIYIDDSELHFKDKKINHKEYEVSVKNPYGGNVKIYSGGAGGLLSSAKDNAVYDRGWCIYLEQGVKEILLAKNLSEKRAEYLGGLIHEFQIGEKDTPSQQT